MEQTLDIYNLITVDETQRWKIPEARKSAKNISPDALKMMKQLTDPHPPTAGQKILKCPGPKNS